MSMPCIKSILACRWSGKCQPYLATSTLAEARLDEVFEGILLHHLLAGSTGELQAVGDDHAVLSGHHVEPLARLLADHVHRRVAARAVVALRRHCLVDARQMLGNAPRPAHNLDELLPWAGAE
jgi:hypothetical protein